MTFCDEAYSIAQLFANATLWLYYVHQQPGSADGEIQNPGKSCGRLSVCYVVNDWPVLAPPFSFGMDPERERCSKHESDALIMLRLNRSSFETGV
jgi:hypothetical protein